MEFVEPYFVHPFDEVLLPGLGADISAIADQGGRSRQNRKLLRQSDAAYQVDKARIVANWIERGILALHSFVQVIAGVSVSLVQRIDENETEVIDSRSTLYREENGIRMVNHTRLGN